MRHVWTWFMALALVAVLAACGQPSGVTMPQDEGLVPVERAQSHGGQVFPLGPTPFDTPGGTMVDETPAAWFVQFATAPSVRGGAATARANERAVFRSAALAERIAYQQRFDFQTLYNGLSVAASPAQIAKLAQLPGVVAVFPVAQIEIPEVSFGSSPELMTALAMTGADIAQNEEGLSGAGIKVGVMDSGIDYGHPDLGGGFGTGARVTHGWDFVGDDFHAGIPERSTPQPNDDPMDCNGHGTHVAGIVGASGTVTGVAPGVTFGAYKVFGCEGSTTADIMLAAMEMALADGMDVLNMSIGSAFQWPQYPTAVAASNLVDAGMVVVASIGNSGASGVYSAGAPGLGENVIGVASFDNTHVALAAFTVSPDDTLIGYGTAAAAPLPPTEGSYPMARTGTTATADDACAPIAEDLTGYVTLIRRGTCAFHTKALNAQNAGAAGVVLYNNAAGRFSPTVAGTPAITIPVVAISDTEGALIDARLAGGAVDMTWTDELLVSTNPTGNLISGFSSYGLSPDLALKPDIGAPGGLIYSTYPLLQGGYATISGTSMSAPHVAGGVALLLEARPHTAAHDVRGLLQNAAGPKNWWGNPGLGFLDNVHRQGAGMLDIPGAIHATTRVSPSMIAAGASDAGPYSTTLRITNDGLSDITYVPSMVNALGTSGSTFAPGFFLGSASVSFGTEAVTVPAGSTRDLYVTITPPSGPNLGQYGGYIELAREDTDAVVARVPFAGFIGDYQEIVALTPGAFGFPLVARPLGGDSYGLVPEGYVFTMEGLDVPALLVHLAHQSRYFEMRILHAADGRPVHPVFHKTNTFEYLSRSATAGSFFAFEWDGTRIQSEMTRGRGNQNELFAVVPDGHYRLEIRVLKALGDASNPAHWESWTSPVITIDRAVATKPGPVQPPGQGRGR